jgi:hypothetical protein
LRTFSGCGPKIPTTLNQNPQICFSIFFFEFFSKFGRKLEHLKRKRIVLHYLSNHRHLIKEHGLKDHYHSPKTFLRLLKQYPCHHLNFYLGETFFFFFLFGIPVLPPGGTLLFGCRDNYVRITFLK